MDSLLFAMAASALFSLRHQHEVLGRLNIQLLAGLVTNQFCVISALGADTLLWGAGDNFSARGKWGGNSPPRMARWLTRFAQRLLEQAR